MVPTPLWLHLCFTPMYKLWVTPLHSLSQFGSTKTEKEKNAGAKPHLLKYNTPPPFLLSIFPRFPSVPSLRGYAILPLQTWPPPPLLFPFLLLLLLLPPLQPTFKLASPPLFKVLNDLSHIIIAFTGLLFAVEQLRGRFVTENNKGKLLWRSLSVVSAFMSWITANSLTDACTRMHMVLNIRSWSSTWKHVTSLYLYLHVCLTINLPALDHEWGMNLVQ